MKSLKQRHRRWAAEAEGGSTEGSGIDEAADRTDEHGIRVLTAPCRFRFRVSVRLAQASVSQKSVRSGCFSS
jgi:hypothetical protein